MGYVMLIMVFVDVLTTYVEVSTVLLCGTGYRVSTLAARAGSHNSDFSKACTVTAEDLDLDVYLPGL